MSEDDAALFDTVRRRLFTAVIGDVMDAAGLCRQFLPAAIRPLRSDAVLVGRAMPVLQADCCGDVVGHSGRPEPFGLMFQALDALRPGEVYVAAGGTPTYALWGGLMTTRARALGAAGAVLGGFHRDTREILSLDLPVFSTGAYAQDQRLRGRVVDYNCPIAFPNGAVVAPGDLMVGDVDGVLVVPNAHVADIVHQALAKAEGEDRVRTMIERGLSTADIFDQTGIM